MEKDLNLFIDNYWIHGYFTTKKANLTVYSISQVRPPPKKLQCIIDLQNQISPLLSFSDCQQIHQLLKQSQNFELCLPQQKITLKWNIEAKNFSKKIECSLDFMQQPLSKVDQLKYENFMLKKKLNQYETNGGMNCAFANNKIPIENQKQKIRQNSNTLLKIEEQIYPHISISSDNFNVTCAQQITKKPIIELSPEKQKRRRGRGRPVCNEASSKKAAKSKQPKKTKAIAKKRKPKKNIQTKNLFIESSISRKNQESAEKKIVELPQSISAKGDDFSRQEINDKSCAKYKKTYIVPNYSLADSSNSESKPVQKKVRLEFQNGDTYFGEVIKDVYNGYGIYSSKNGSYFEGHWKDGKAEGKGTSIDQFGNKYSGNFLCDKRHGQGVQIYENGERYEGSFQDDFKWGHGKYIYQNGDYYEGNWKENMCQGSGREVYVDGTTFQGNWKEDEKNGEGILIKSNGEKYKQYYQMGELIKQILLNDKVHKNMF